MANAIDEDFEDALSLCDLPLSDHDSDSSTDHEFLKSSSTGLDFFEFSTSSSSPSLPNSSIDTLLFCGKLISSKSNFESTTNQSRNKTLTSSCSSSNAFIPPQSKSMRCSSSRYNGCRKQKVMIGLAKIPSTMEINDLRERHNRRTISPPPTFTAVEKGGESAVVSGKGSGGKSRRWGLLRAFRCRAQDMGSLLATSSSSIGCLRIARPCFD